MDLSILPGTYFIVQQTLLGQSVVGGWVCRRICRCVDGWLGQSVCTWVTFMISSCMWVVALFCFSTVFIYFPIRGRNLIKTHH